MSASSAVAARAAGPATATIKRTEGDLKKWLTEVIDGNGSSPAQMIITVVLGCIPYVGQAIDARNIIIGVMDVSEEPDNTERWIDLVLALVALVPGFGDALKNVFKMLRMGKPLGRILDALPNQLRGNVEKWFRTLNWARYARDITALADTILLKLINLLDGWVTKAVMGSARVQQIVKQLRHMQRLAQRKIDEVMQGLQASYKRALGDPLPSTVAAGPSARVTAKAAPPGSSASGSVKSTSGGSYTPPQGQAGGTHRQSPPQRSNSATGASGEHITDYYFVKRNKNRAKVSNRGVLFEYQQPGHHGIDHVWHHAGLPFKYRISDTKATGKRGHKLMTPRAAFEALRMGVDVYLGMEEQKRAGGAVGSTNNHGVQLSHLWVARKIASAGLVGAHASHLLRAIEAWERVKFKAATEMQLKDGQPRRVAVRCPYDRSLVTVVGANLDMHDKAKGGDLPRCSRPVRVHQIAAEFVMPTEMLER